MITAEHLLNTSVTLERREAIDDGMGGQETAWRTVGRLPARISQPPSGGLTGGEVIAAMAQRTLMPKVYLEPGADVLRGDRLIAGDGRRLTVEAIVEPSEPAYRRADCTLHQEGL